MARIKVISGDKDGAELRREKHSTKQYVQARGKNDQEDINDALRTSVKGQTFVIEGEAWERIFGRKGYGD